MRVFRSISEVDIIERPVASIGTFDGVHLGHQEVLGHLISEAKKRNTKSLLITFDPHPRIVLNKGVANLRFINNPEEKIEILSHFGLDYLLILPFSLAFSKTTARDFIQDYLIDKLHVQAMTIGYDHHFGRMDAETVDVEVLLKSFGIQVERIPEKDVQSVSVSSTKIRQAIQEGNMELASELLGYPYSLCGEVIHGNEIGRDIGFPTANLDLSFPMKLLPADGVYVGLVSYESKKYKAMLNIGHKPTVPSKNKSIEVHLLGFDKTIYGEQLKVKVLHKIRDEQHFPDLQALKLQLEKDKLIVRDFFAQFTQ